MRYDLSVDAQTCISCMKCVRICPVHIFQANTDKKIYLQNPEYCIACGHCVGVCPTDSVVHSEFPSDKVHEIDYTKMPSAESVMLLCKERRSNRAFSKKPIPKEYLDLILEAGHVAPTASNKQEVKFMLITNPERLISLSKFTLDIFQGAVRKLENPLLKPVLKKLMPDAYKYVPTFKSLQEEFDKGNDMIMRNATAAIIIYAPKANRFGCEDSNLAYQNASLMAESLGVSQFYMGFVYSATKQSGGDRLAKELGIDGTIHAAMALGMPSFRFKNYIDKKPIDLITIE